MEELKDFIIFFKFLELKRSVNFVWKCTYLHYMFELNAVKFTHTFFSIQHKKQLWIWQSS